MKAITTKASCWLLKNTTINKQRTETIHRKDIAMIPKLVPGQLAASSTNMQPEITNGTWLQSMIDTTYGIMGPDAPKKAGHPE